MVQLDLWGDAMLRICLLALFLAPAGPKPLCPPSRPNCDLQHGYATPGELASDRRDKRTFLKVMKAELGWLVVFTGFGFWAYRKPSVR